ncbi:hypothetical protein DC498_01695 [Terrimonas sp.]|nr:hypothetical protein DC498_01695 [Terrimonas sp.]
MIKKQFSYYIILKPRHYCQAKIHTAIVFLLRALYTIAFCLLIMVVHLFFAAPALLIAVQQPDIGKMARIKINFSAIRIFADKKLHFTGKTTLITS